MIDTSILVLSCGLLYHDERRGSGEQTIHPGWAVPVSYLHSSATLTGSFLAIAYVSSESQTS